MRSSLIFLVSVVTSTRSLRSTRSRTSFMRSSIWLRVSRTSTSRVDDARSGGRSARRRAPSASRSYWPGVAETNTICGVIERNSSKVCGRLSSALGQPEAVVDQRLLARAVALVHAADLRHGLVGLVDEADEVLGEVVDQAVRPVAGHAAVEDARVVLDAVAEAHLAQHLHVVLRALAQAVGLEQLALGLQLGAARVELAPDLLDRLLERALRTL